MDKYEQLKEIVDDYILHMNLIAADRYECQNQELEFIKREVQVFNLLQQNLHLIQEQNRNVLSEDQ